MHHTRPSKFEKLFPVSGASYLPFGPVGPRRWSRALLCSGLILAVICVGGVGAAAWYGWPWTEAARKTQVVVREPVVTEVLCDVSDPLTTGQQEQIRRIFDEELPAQSHRGDYMIVAQLSASVEAPIHLHFKGLDSGQPDDCANPLFCTPLAEKRRRDEQFLVPYGQAVRRCLEPGERAITPLVEGHAHATRLPEFTAVSPGSRRRLIVLTDGLMHVPGKASAYEREPTKGKGKNKKGGDFTLYSAAARRYVAGNLAQLQNVEVIVLFIRRPGNGAAQDYRLREWLEAYYTHSGARLPIQFREIW